MTLDLEQTMFDVVDEDGWLGVESETLEGAKRACEVLAAEGYDLPLGVVAPGERFALCWMHDVDHNGHGRWQGSAMEHRFVTRDYAVNPYRKAA
jgi:hypothetical protein